MIGVPRLVGGAFALVMLAGAFGQGQSNPKLNDLIVYGDGIAFRVKEPYGWHGDTDKIAAKFQVNVAFLPSNGSDSAKSDVSIRVRVNHKVDENTIEDLNYDMQGYKKEFPKAQFSELNVVHAEYKTFARTVFVPGEFYEYVTYLNPGVGRSVIFSVAMSKENEPATDSELKAYETVLKSVVWLSSDVKVK